MVKVYFPQEAEICIHQERVKKCPSNFPAGFYWYGRHRRGPGRPPKWVQSLLEGDNRKNEPTPHYIKEDAMDISDDESCEKESDRNADSLSNEEVDTSGNMGAMPSLPVYDEVTETNKRCKYPLRSHPLGRTL